MAVNKSISAIGSRNHHKFTLNVQETSTQNNDSILSFSFVLSPVSTGWDWYGWGNKISYSINIGGNVYTGTIPDYNGSSTVTLKSSSGIKIPHDADGTKTISIGFSVNDGAGQAYTPGNASKSDKFKLTDLHKPPVITVGDVSELNTKLTNIGISADTFVTQLSKKSIPINTTLYDNATVKSYKITNGSVELTRTEQPIVIDYSTTKLDYKYNDSIKKNVATFVFGVLDSKNGYSTATKQYSNIILYEKPNLIPTASSVKRNGQLTGKVKLNLTGTFYNSSVGTVNNKIKLSYKYWKSSESEPTAYFEIPSNAYTISGNNISMFDWHISKNSTEISDVDRSSSYLFKIKAVDSFNSVSEITLTCTKGEWIMAKFKNRVDFKKITIEGKELTSNEQVGCTATAWLGEEFSFAANSTVKIPFTEFETDNEEYFALSNNGIKILKDCIVLVWLQWGTWGSYGRYAYIVLNNKEKESFAQAVGGSVQTMMVLKCKANDVIYGNCYAEGTNKMSSAKNQSYLTATIIK